MLKILIFLCFSVISLLAQKDTLILAVENEIPRINPAFSEDHDEAVALVFSGLTRFDENLSLKGDLAKSWKISQNGLVYEFDLRDDVLWHDGVKFDARDVKFSLEAFKNPKNNSSLRIRFEELEKVEILNPYKVKITLKNPYPAFLDALSIGIIPAHLLENKDLNTDKFNQNPIGTGAFKFVQWKKGEYMEFKANENYHLGKVQTQRLFLKRINDPNVAALALKNSQIDAALIESSLLKTFKEDSKFEILREKSADYRALMFNLDNEFLKDRKVRLALNYAVDKEMIVKNILHDYGFKASHPLELSWANQGEFKTFDYNPKKARFLLEEAGFKKNEQGFYEKDSKLLEFDIYAMSNDPLRVVLAGILQSEFKKIGVKTNVKTKLAGSFDYSKVDSFLIGWGSPYDPDFHTFNVFTSFNDTKLNPKGWNFGHYHNAKVDESLIKARTSFKQEERLKYYKEFIDAINEDPPFIFLVYLDFALVYDKNIKGIKPMILGHHGVGFSWNVYEWSKD
ncbi:MAG: ABC transporter substrate-binding protein [Campylobacter sp.]|nr:ABC transporter substrate-binding protein [Campylobacter sp.]